MTGLFYVSAVVAVIACLAAVTRANAMHALLFLVTGLFAIALVFLALGAPFIAALEVIVYAGAIVVLFLFALMFLNFGPQAVGREMQQLGAHGWAAPAALSAVLLAALASAIVSSDPGFTAQAALTAVSPVSIEDVGASLFGGYAVAVELASLLLLVGLVGAMWIGRQRSGVLALSGTSAEPPARLAGPDSVPVPDNQREGETVT